MESLHVVLSSVVPAFAIVGLGYIFGRRKLVEITHFINFVIYLGTPCLVIESLGTQHIDLASMGLTCVAAVFVVFFVGGLVLVYQKLTADRESDVPLCSMFGNTANIPWPVALFAFGEIGLSYQVVYAVTTATLLYSVGVIIAAGKANGVMRFLKLPLIYATVIGLALSIADVQLPPIVMRPIAMLGDTAIPLLLFSLGAEIGICRPGLTRSVAAIVGLRVLGGALAGFLFVLVTSPSPDVQRAVLLACASPCAVHAFMLRSKFSASADRAASAVFYSTVAAVIYLPILLAYLRTL